MTLLRRSAPRELSRRWLEGAVFAVVALSAATASAHITLQAPPSWVVESALGDPQKAPPCGGPGTTTGVVTTFRAGETITVQWKETVGHPGHFRIALAKDRAELVDPKVQTTAGDGVSGNSVSAAIADPPTYPVLLDGLFPRTSVPGAQAAPFTQKVTLPSTPCDHCTLQVLQFMAGHAPGYFYHHCADVRILAVGASLPGGGDAAAGLGSPDAAAGSRPGGGAAGDSGGCSLSARRAVTAPGRGEPILLLCAAMAMWRRRERRAARSEPSSR